ncbi:hypothetical protein OEA41_009936 [Lepraria neglecta]|uniref:Uncharacterized protein n=1 Tax=Lepraria neglecta TaxID=209136 RepID=A0AAE0DEN4_9LECA|nr:hypothetical protein OEA41_009936 [Lepraria neglecta]
MPDLYPALEQRLQRRFISNSIEQDKDLDVPHVLTFYVEPPKGMPKNLYLESVTGKN